MMTLIERRFTKDKSDTSEEVLFIWEEVPKLIIHNDEEEEKKCVLGMEGFRSEA